MKSTEVHNPHAYSMLYTNCSCCCIGKDKRSFYPEKVHCVSQLSREDNMSRTLSYETCVHVLLYLARVSFQLHFQIMITSAGSPLPQLANMPFRMSAITAGHETSTYLYMYNTAPVCHAIEPTGWMVYSHEIAHVELAHWLITLLSACVYLFETCK